MLNIIGRISNIWVVEAKMPPGRVRTAIIITDGSDITSFDRAPFILRRMTIRFVFYLFLPDQYIK